MSLGLKLFFLRTRVKKLTQTQLAAELGIRQATISSIEQGVSEPSLPLLRCLCAYFDVTPTYLLDEANTLEVQASDRWSNRGGLAAAGQYLEVPDSSLHPLEGDTNLVALLPGTPIYDEEAAKVRSRFSHEQELAEAYRIEMARRRKQEKELSRELETERQTSRLRRRGLSRKQARKYM